MTRSAPLFFTGAAILCLGLVASLGTVSAQSDPAAPAADAPAVPSPAEATAPADSAAAELESAYAHVHGEMALYYELVTQARDALTFGDLAPAQVRLQRVADTPPPGGLPDGWLPWVASMNRRAANGAAASNLSTAAATVGALAADCGGCHADVATAQVFPDRGLRRTGTDVEHHMRRHAWALQQMWDGLTGPSDDRWQAGAEALDEHAIGADSLPEGVADPTAALAIEGILHSLAAEAATATTAVERGEVYGRLLGTCAGCHDQMFSTIAE